VPGGSFFRTAISRVRRAYSFQRGGTRCARPTTTCSSSRTGGASAGSSASCESGARDQRLRRDRQVHQDLRHERRRIHHHRHRARQHSVNLSLTELDKGSWVIFQLPGFTTAASGTQQNSLDALRTASDTSYFKGQDALWVKVVSNGDAGNGAPGGGTSVQVNR
jgi:hypothetical protein